MQNTTDKINVTKSYFKVYNSLLGGKYNPNEIIVFTFLLERSNLPKVKASKLLHMSRVVYIKHAKLFDEIKDTIDTTTGFHQIPYSVMYDENIKSSSKVLFAILNTWFNRFDRDDIFITNEKLANEIGVSSHTIINTLKTLEEAGYIRREAKSKENQYDTRILIKNWVLKDTSKKSKPKVKEVVETRPDMPIHLPIPASNLTLIKKPSIRHINTTDTTNDNKKIHSAFNTKLRRNK